jgi:hypothetical protein
MHHAFAHHRCNLLAQAVGARMEYTPSERDRHSTTDYKNNKAQQQIFTYLTLYLGKYLHGFAFFNIPLIIDALMVF